MVDQAPQPLANGASRGTLADFFTFVSFLFPVSSLKTNALVLPPATDHDSRLPAGSCYLSSSQE